MSADDPMTLRQLLAKLQEATPYMEERAADVIEHNAAWNLRPGQSARALVREQGHAALLAIGIMDFLCWAFDEPTSGYMPDEGLRR